MMNKLRDFCLKIFVVARMLIFVAFLLFCFGFVIESSQSIPGYALVFLDDTTKTYISWPCVEAWKRRANGDVSRRSTASEAWRLGYKMDEDCRDASGFIDAERSPSGMLLQSIGILPPITHWWDEPYQTDDGAVIWPKQAQQQ